MASSSSSLVRQVYLITYSQVNKEKCPSKEKLSDFVIEEFGSDLIEKWVCCEEPHKDGGSHYHFACKLIKLKRWKMIKLLIRRKHSISVNFSDHHTNYYSAYKYVIKDGDFISSESHPDYTNIPQTTPASKKRRSESVDKALGAKLNEGESGSGDNTKAARQRSSDLVDVFDMIVRLNITTDLELCAQVNKELSDGKRDLAKFVLSKGEKARNDIISTSWKIHGAPEQLKLLKHERMAIFEECAETECCCETPNLWCESACEIIDGNGMRRCEFASSIFKALKEGRKKDNNIMLVGPSNIGKTFLLKPLCKIFKVFANPATTTFAWVGAELADIVFLNDFRWSEKVMAWADILNMLEGCPVHIAAPKSHYSQDILWQCDTPIFCTSSTIIRKYDNGRLNEMETEMMSTRWRVFKFTNPIANPRDIKPCVKCFYQFITVYRER